MYTSIRLLCESLLDFRALMTICACPVLIDISASRALAYAEALWTTAKCDLLPHYCLCLIVSKGILCHTCVRRGRPYAHRHPHRSCIVLWKHAKQRGLWTKALRLFPHIVGSLLSVATCIKAPASVWAMHWNSQPTLVFYKDLSSREGVL